MNGVKRIRGPLEALQTANFKRVVFTFFDMGLMLGEYRTINEKRDSKPNKKSAKVFAP